MGSSCAARIAGTMPLMTPPRLIEDDCGQGKAPHIDVKAGLQIVAEGAHQGQGSYQPRNNVSDGDPADSSSERDGQGFCQELEQDMNFVCAQPFSIPISRVLCCTETSIMFIKPIPPMPKVSTPMKASKILKVL